MSERAEDRPAQDAEIRTGTILGNTYRIERELGRGGMGVVWEASHVRVPKRVAVKVLKPDQDRDQLARFRQEAEIASRLGHPNIVTVLDFDVLPSGAAYLVMELLEGTSLAARLHGGALSAEQAFPIVRQIAAALQAAHDAGVVHRDLKPANVFLVPRERDGTLVDHVKILDFGISKVEGSAVRTREDVVLGTPRYMAPEQATASHARVDGRTDQFSLAVMVFEMLAGVPPFDGSNGTQVMFDIVYKEPPPLRSLARDVEPAVAAAIHRALSKDPRDRYPTVSAFVEALTGKPLAETTRRTESETVRSTPARSAADGIATANDRPRLDPAPEVSRRRARRRLAIAGLVTAVGVLVLVATMAVLRRDERSAAHAASSEASREPRVASPHVPSFDHEPAPIAHEPVPGDGAVPSDNAALADAAVQSAPPAPVPSPRSRTRRTQHVPPDVAAELAATEAAVSAGHFDEAQAIAKRVLYRGKYTGAYAILAVVACAQRDLGGAHAWMRNVPRSEWAVIKSRCRDAGLAIGDPE